jgi:hypothetical protein
VNTFTEIVQLLNIRALHRRIDKMEDRMATNDEIIARLRAATDTLAAKIRQLSEGDSRFEPILAELEAMGTDPSNPVPDPGTDVEPV